MNINGKTALVTGAGSGMGAETANYLSSQGCHVVLLDMNEEAVVNMAKQVNGTPIVCDVAHGQELEDSVKGILDQHPEIRIAVNCAGVAPAKRIVGREGPMELSAFSQVIETNLIGTFNMMRVLATHMSQLPLDENKEERGVIINTASVAAYEGQIGQAAYSASKGGIVAMTLPAARELAQFAVRIMTIAPGLIATPLLLAMPQEIQDTLASQVPFPKRLGKPSEYAMLVGHIINNPLLNGEVIRLDGGIRMSAKN